MEEEEKNSDDHKEKEEVETDDEDDCEGYFLEPVGESVNVAEKIAEANRKLFEDVDDEGEDVRPRKVQFSEDLVNFEPDTIYDLTDSTIESASVSDLNLIPEEEKEDENDEIPLTPHSKPNENFEGLGDAVGNLNCGKLQTDDVDDIEEEIDEVEIPDEKRTDEEPFDVGNNIKTPEESSKFLLILLPQEQNSSCESVIGEEIFEDEIQEVLNDDDPGPADIKKPFGKPKVVRPKSAGSLKHRKTCEASQNILTNFSYLPKSEKKTSPAKKIKNGEVNKKLAGVGDTVKTTVEKINVSGSEKLRTSQVLVKCERRGNSTCNQSGKTPGDFRPKTAPVKRTCCVIKADLPRYNGLRSEYGLSAEQLQERKLRSRQMKYERKQERQKQKQEEQRKKHQNEEIFQRWLSGKNKKESSKKPAKGTDTLARSDAYIQSHASYASNPNVPYSVGFRVTRRFGKKVSRNANEKKLNKTIVLEKLMSNISPQFKKSFNIYLGTRQ